jgi:hypothetical protein
MEYVIEICIPSFHSGHFIVKSGGWLEHSVFVPLALGKMKLI